MKDDFLRWDPYFLMGRERFTSFWREYLGVEERNILYILGAGFDPRMCKGILHLLHLGGKGKRDCLLVEFDEGEESSSRQYMTLARTNLDKLIGLMQGKGLFQKESVQMWSRDDIRKRRTGSFSAGNIISRIKNFDEYTDIVIDISAMPQSIYFPLIGSCLSLIDKRASNSNLHIIVCENVTIDKWIYDDGIDDKAYYIRGFGSDLENEATEGIPKIWIPVLGEGNAVKLERIYTLVNPDEICPILPSPSKNPRQGDDILLEYRELIFDQWRVEPKNIIYSNEQNPFEAYRQICRTVLHYEQALKPLGGCKFAITAVSSKLISLGALLAAYELKRKGKSIGIAHIESQGYRMELDRLDIDANNELFTLWLSGGCYEK